MPTARSRTRRRARFSWLTRRAARRAIALGAVALATLAGCGDAGPQRPQPGALEPFGDVDAFLTARGITGSTEDLAFTPDGERLVMGVPGGLIALDPQGEASSLPLTGDPLLNPLGVAYDRAGNLWVADSAGSALRRVLPSGEVTTPLTTDGEQPLVAPNYVAIDREDRVLLSDPCLGELIRFDPVTGRVDAVLRFDVADEGGPNGFAFAPDGRLWIATENTALFCGHSFVGLTDPVASLLVVDVDDEGFGTPETVVADFALFGDGVAFDAAGNLYVIFDTEVNFTLEESAIWFLPPGGAVLEKLVGVSDRVLANLAFGSRPFGDQTLYVSLLAVPPFTSPNARGAERIEVGIRGLPLLP
ncbi:MAG TPA: hypothetical protein VIS07_12230 [Candidatus Binatia bacterium]